MQEVWGGTGEAVPSFGLLVDVYILIFSWLLAANKWQFYLAATFVITGEKKDL